MTEASQQNSAQDPTSDKAPPSTVYKLSQTVSSDQLAAHLNLQLIGGPYEINCIAGLGDAQYGALSFAKKKPRKETSALLITSCESCNHRLQSDNPRLDFIRSLQWLIDESLLVRPKLKAQIDPTAIVSPRASIADHVIIGPHTVVDAFAVIHDNVTIGASCHVQSSAVIGGPGFGFERDNEGRPIRFPHLGGVQIGDHVEIGSNTSIDRGTLVDTVIGSHTKIDNLVHIAHNVQIGESCLVVSGSVLCGSVRLEEGVWVAPNAVVHQGRTIGAGATLGIGACVIQNVAPESTMIGHCATVLRLPTAKNSRK